MENKKFWCEFLDLYKELPALWRIKSSDYSNRIIKANAYEELVEKLREIYPDANREMVVKKINVFRTTYRKELRKVKSSQKSGAGTDEVYQPSLWYFDKLNFLEDQDESFEGIPTMEDKNGEVFKEARTSENTSSISRLLRNRERLNLPSRSKRKKISDEDELIKIACEQLQSSQHTNSESDFLAKSWALQYKEMQGSQKLLARKIISDVLFHGCMGTLNISHTVEIQQMLLNCLSTEQ